MISDGARMLCPHFHLSPSPSPSPSQSHTVSSTKYKHKASGIHFDVSLATSAHYTKLTLPRTRFVSRSLFAISRLKCSSWTPNHPGIVAPQAQSATQLTIFTDTIFFNSRSFSLLFCAGSSRIHTLEPLSATACYVRAASRHKVEFALRFPVHYHRQTAISLRPYHSQARRQSGPRRFSPLIPLILP